MYFHNSKKLQDMNKKKIQLEKLECSSQSNRAICRNHPLDENQCMVDILITCSCNKLGILEGI